MFLDRTPREIWISSPKERPAVVDTPGPPPAAMTAPDTNGKEPKDANPAPADNSGGEGSTNPLVNGLVDSSESGSVDHVVEKTPKEEKVTVWQKIKNHFRRFWKWHIVAFIIFLVIFLPILFKVIFPAVLQDVINSQKLPILGGTLQVISASQLNMSLLTQLNSPISAKLNPTDLELYNASDPGFTPYFHLELPGLTVHNKKNVSVTNQTTTIQNMNATIAWLSEVFDQEEAEVSVKGHVGAATGAIHMGAQLKKTVKFKGLNHLKGFAINELELVLPAKPDGTNVQGTVNLPNWGVLTMGLGNLTLNIFSGNSDLKLGVLQIDDVILPPGNHSFPFRGQLYLKDIASNLGEILTSQTTALESGNLAISTTGNASTYNGEHLPLVEGVLNGKRISTEMSVISLTTNVISGLLGGGSTNLTDVLGDMVGNKTFVNDVLDNFKSAGGLDDLTGNTNSTSSKKTRSVLSKRSNLALLWKLSAMSLSF